MNKLYKHQYRIITMLVLALLFQIVAPLASGSLIAAKTIGEAFQITSTSVADGTATIEWAFELRSDAVAIETSPYTADFTLEQDQSGDLIARGGTVIGRYRITEEGQITASIDGAEAIRSRGDFTTQAAVDGAELLTAHFAGSIVAQGVQDKGAKPAMGLFGAGAGVDLGNIFTDVGIKMNGQPIPEGMPIEITADTNLRVEYLWAVDHAVNAGDWAKTTLPQGIQLLKDETGELTTSIDGTQVPIASYELSLSDNSLTIIFNDALKDADQISGNAWVDFEFDLDKFETNTTQVIKFANPINKDFTIKVKPQSGGSIIQKTGQGNASLNATEITWTVDINTALDTINGAIVTDTLPQGLVLKGDVEIYDLIVGYKGGITVGGKTKEDQKAFDINLGDITSAYRIVYTTKITDTSKTSFTNAATIKGTGPGGPVNETKGYKVNTPTGEPIKKLNGIPDKGGINSNSITWKIQANAVESTIDGAKIHDQLPEGLALRANSLKIYHLTIGAGGLLTRGSEAAGKSYTYDPGTRRIQIDLGDIKTPYEIEYITDIEYGPDLETVYDTTVVFDNTATLTNSNHVELGQNTGTTSVYRGQPSEKTGTKNISTGLKKIDWVIKVNETEDTIYDVWIEDKSGPGISLMGEPIVKKGNTILTKGIDYTLQMPGDERIPGGGQDDFKIVLIPNKIDSAYTVEYSTRIDNLNQSEFTNAARVSWIPRSKGPGTGPGDPNRIYKDISNSAGASVGDIYNKKSTHIDYKNKIMGWEIALDFYKGKTTNLVITDTFPHDGLVFMEQGLEITYAGNPLTKGTHYTVTPKDGSYGKGFILTFNGAYENNSMRIKYSTSFDPDYEGFIPNNSNSAVYKNEAKITGSTTYKGETKSIDAPPVKAEKKIIDVAFKDGRKVGTLDREAREISWDIYVNYMEKDFKNPPFKTPFILEDTLGPGQTFDKSTLQVRKYTINTGGGGWNIGEVVPSDDYNVVETAAGVTPKGFTLTFPDGINERYVVQFKTTIDGISKAKYTNQAIATGGKNLSAEVTYPEYKNFLIKSAVDPAGNEIKQGHRVWIDDQVDWRLKINESLSDIEAGAKIVDTIGSALIYINDTVEIVDEAGVILSPDKYDVETAPDGANTKLTITFKERISKRYTVKYSTVVATAEGSIVNSASFSGETEIGTTTDGVTIKIRQSSAGGSGAGINTKGSIIINKVDETGAAIKAEAEFKIYYMLNGEERLVGGTNHKTVDGKIEINGLSFRKYFIKEVKAPTGFEFDENAAPIEVVLNTAAGVGNINAHRQTIENTHKKKGVTATKVWVDGPEDKPDIALQLYRKVGNGPGEAVGDPVTLAGGQVGVRETTYTWEALDITNNAGEEYTYTVDEVGVPPGYKKTLDGLTVTNTFQIEKGPVTAHKVWLGGPDAKPTISLQLYRDGNQVAGKLAVLSPGNLTHTWTGLDKTDASGRAYVYTVKEVDVPQNYQATYNGLTVTNTYVSPKTTIIGKKIWDGGPTPKPDVQLQLYRNGAALGDPVTLTGGTTAYEWTVDLNDKNGVAYNYAVDEIGVPENYGKSNTDQLTVTNTYGSPLMDIKGQKVWIGGPTGKPTVKLELYRNGVSTGKFGEIESGSNEYVWKGLEKTDHAGIDYQYTVKEVNTPANYTQAAEGLTVTNTYVSPKTEVTGTKVWVDGPADKPTIELQLYRTLPNVAPEAVGDPVALESGTTQYTWKDLDETDANGRPYIYTIDEVETPNNYAQTKSADGLTITNTYVIPKTSVKGTKVWINGPAKKPTIELQLYKNAEALGEPVALENGLTQYTWEDLDVTDEAGRPYQYTVKEVNPPANYISKAEALTVTNTYTSPKIAITGIKEWKGGPPTKPTIELQLYRNGVAYGEPVPLPGGTLTYTWTDLDERDQDGDSYVYTIDEVSVPYRYTKTALDNGLKILNTFRPYEEPDEPGGGGGSGPKDPENPDPTDPEKPDPTDPTDPEEPEKPEKPDPVDPQKPDPTDPKDPEKPDPTDPNTPAPTDPVEPPRYRPTEIPDPNDPDSPDEFILIDEDGVPMGKYTKKENPDGTIIYVDEEGIPLGGGKQPDPDSSPGISGESVPKTGDEMPVLPLAILFVVSLFSAIGLMIFKKKRCN